MVGFRLSRENGQSGKYFHYRSLVVSGADGIVFNDEVLQNEVLSESLSQWQAALEKLQTLAKSELR